MSNPNPPTEQTPSITAAELRRRLLSSTPPPAAATASTPEAAEEETGEAVPAWQPGNPLDMLARLRMPGRSGPLAVPPPRPAPVVNIALDPTPTRSPVNRRTPLPGGRPDSSAAIAGALNQLAELPDSNGQTHDRYVPDDQTQADAKITRLKAENKELRKLLDEMKHLLQEASDTEQQLVAKQKEFETALAAKDTHIEELSAHLGTIEEQIAKGELAPPPPIPKTRTELEEWADELEKENAQTQQARKKLDNDRQQLREDEESLEAQMREMEVSMARERALIARQETELRRLSAEIQHELEVMQRGDANLRDQMAKFQRRAQEVVAKPGVNGRR